MYFIWLVLVLVFHKCLFQDTVQCLGCYFYCTWLQSIIQVMQEQVFKLMTNLVLQLRTYLIFQNMVRTFVTSNPSQALKSTCAKYCMLGNQFQSVSSLAACCVHFSQCLLCIQLVMATCQCMLKLPLVCSMAREKGLD